MASQESFAPSQSPASPAETTGARNDKDIIVGPTQGEDQAAAEEKQEASRTEEIEHLYLTFDTILPTPAGISSPERGLPPPPECPDLKQYISPFLWSKSRKTLITWLACAVTTLAAYSAGEHAPAASQLLPVWNVSLVAFEVGITTFTTGFAIAPMVLAPFSEINGRRPVFISSGILFTGMKDKGACLVLASTNLDRR